MSIKDLICIILFSPGLGAAIFTNWILEKLNIIVNPSGNEGGTIFFILIAVIFNAIFYISAFALTIA